MSVAPATHRQRRQSAVEQLRLLLKALAVVGIGMIIIPLWPSGLPEVGAQADATLPSPSAALIGSQGLDTSLPLTESAVTDVAGRGEFDGLRITVNQTANLTNQAVSITWSGGTPSTPGLEALATNYLSIMQCWGDDDGSVPENPGPPPEQCVYGARTGQFGGVSGFPLGFTSTRVIGRPGWESYDEADGPLVSGNQWREFRAVDGNVVGAHTNASFNPSESGGQFWTNPDFNVNTTNEIVAARTYGDGTGAALFQIKNSTTSPGLGCGERKLARTNADGSTSDPEVPKCWLVVVPRSTALTENAGSQFANLTEVATSPLGAAAWENRIAIPLDFTPVDSPCGFDAPLLFSGSEVPSLAIGSWQPAICAGGDLPPFNYVRVNDNSARRNFAAGAEPVVMLGGPLNELESEAVEEVYAPITISGVGIGFNLQRVPDPTFQAEFGPDLEAQRGVPVADLNLTPRLVAKLLTQSYGDALRISGQEPPLPEYDWLTDNPRSLDKDPDFLRFNPELIVFDPGSQRRMANIVFPVGDMDAIGAVWKWIAADPEAMAWLAGEPDEFGMRVNPRYSTDADLNPFRSPLDPTTRVNFPKDEPFCATYPVTKRDVTPPERCGSDWQPASSSLVDAAQFTAEASDGARMRANANALTASSYWSRETPQTPGRQAVLSVTDTASAARFGVQMARLSVAGDNRADRDFVAPTISALQAGMRSSTIDEATGFRLPNPSPSRDNAYPLTIVTHLAANPFAEGLDDTTRAAYAGLIEYAAGAGQEAGLQLGELPPGFAPLSSELQEEALAAATLMRDPSSLIETTTTTTTVPASVESTTTTTAATTVTTAPTVNTTANTTARTTNSSSNTVRPNTSSGSGSGSPTTPTSATTTTLPPATDGGTDDDAAADEPQDDTEDAADEVATTVASAAPATTVAEDVERPVTPEVTPGVGRLAVPGMGAAALATALVGLEITKRPRRRGGSSLLEGGS